MASDQRNPLEKARALEKRVLRHNDVDATVDLGCLLLYNDNFVALRERGVQMLERAIKQGQHSGAMRVLANYLLETGCRKDYCRAVSLFEESLKLEEHPFALKRLGDCYVLGCGVAKDDEVAAHLCERALRLGEHPYVMVSLALHLLNVPKLHAQKKRAVALFERAIKASSNADMMHLLATYYHFGSANMSPCQKRAAKWYTRAIETSKHGPSMINLAELILDNEPNSEDVQRAVQLLEDALEVQDHDEETVLDVADLYKTHGIDHDRAFQLYQNAAIRYNSKEARKKVLQLLAADMAGGSVDHARALDYFEENFKKNKNYDSFVFAGAMKWSGTNDLEMNRKEAIAFLREDCSWSKHCSFSLMLRHDLSSYPSGEKRARRLMKLFDNNVDRSNLSHAESIILSESGCESDKLLALESFRAQMTLKSLSPRVAWLPPYLRRSKRKIPFDGRVDCFTSPVRRFSQWTHVAALNLASLLLEIEGKEQEAVAVLEGVMNSKLKLIATLNLAHILMENVKGVTQDWSRGMQLVEDVVEETNDASARAMLANALTEATDGERCDVERGWKLWQGVQREVEDEQELRKIRRLISTNSEDKWRLFSSRQDDDVGEQSGN